MVRKLGTLVAAIVLIVPVWAHDHQDTKQPPAAKNAGMEILKQLVGEWIALDAKGQPTTQVVSVFKVTAGGSAVHETIFPGTPHEMVSVYHLDGKDLVLTHYCAAKNQPRMKADPTAPANKLVFKFAGGANIDPAKDMHMHEGSITLINADNIEWAWHGWANGKAVDEHKVAMKLARKK